MPDNLSDHKSPGQPLKIDAATWNDVLDATRRVKTGRIQGLEGATIPAAILPSLTVLVRNDTGSTRAVRGVYRLGDPLTDVDARPEEFQGRPVFEGLAPDGVAPVAVALEPIGTGGVGRAVVAGVAVAEVDVASTSHGHAGPSNGVTANLVSSGSSTGVRLLWQPGSTGVQTCVVLLGVGTGLDVGVVGVSPRPALDVQKLDFGVARSYPATRFYGHAFSPGTTDTGTWDINANECLEHEPTPVESVYAEYTVTGLTAGARHSLYASWFGESGADHNPSALHEVLHPDTLAVITSFSIDQRTASSQYTWPNDVSAGQTMNQFYNYITDFTLPAGITSVKVRTYHTGGAVQTQASVIMISPQAALDGDDTYIVEESPDGTATAYVKHAGVDNPGFMSEFEQWFAGRKWFAGFVSANFRGDAWASLGSYSTYTSVKAFQVAAGGYHASHAPYLSWASDPGLGNIDGGLPFSVDYWVAGGVIRVVVCAQLRLHFAGSASYPALHVTGGGESAKFSGLTTHEGGIQVAAGQNIAVGSDLVLTSGNAALGAISTLTPAADRVAYFTGAATAALATYTAFARSLDDDPDAATARTTLGLGTIATQAASAVTITGGTITGITDLAVADGGTGASDAAGARTNLGLGTAATQNTGTSGANVPLLDGANTWSGAQSVAALLDAQQNVRLSGDINATLTADQNNWNPTGLATASVIRVTAGADFNVTGLSGGADGRVIALVNEYPTLGGVLKLNDENAASTAANRFGFNGKDLWLYPGEGCLLWYNSTSSRWQLLAGPPQQAAVTYARFQALTACSIFARSANSTGVGGSVALNADGKFPIRRAGVIVGDVLGESDLPTVSYDTELINGGTTYTITANSAYEDTGTSVALPSAGLYLLTCKGSGFVRNSAVAAGVFVRLFDVTLGVELVESVTFAGETSVVNQTQRIAFALAIPYRVAGATTIRLDAQRMAVGTWSISQIATASSGRTTLSFVRIGG